jgi:hypothetical protein
MLKIEEKNRDEIIEFLGRLLLPSGVGTQRDAVIGFLQKLEKAESPKPIKEKK